MPRIGIPCALLYHGYGTLWIEFFHNIGCEVVLSGETTKQILDSGVKIATDQTCLPVKTYLGHVASLVNSVDWIFLPRIVSIEKSCYICPKFMGLPDMVKANVRNLPSILSPVINGYSGKDSLKAGMMEVSAELGIGRRLAERAYGKAFSKNNESEKQLLDHGRELLDSPGKSMPKVAVLGHPYNIDDNFVSMRLLDKLPELGVMPITYQMLDPSSLLEGISQIRRELFWTYGSRLVGAAKYLISHDLVEGVVHLSSFGCGPDAFTEQMIASDCRKHGDLPLLILTIDEHTGEAGFLTRLEAFVDMLERRRRTA